MITSGTVPDPSTEPHVTALELTGFRNYARLSLRLDARHVVLSGPNGAGKTNLMEAVSLLTPGRGLRRASLRDMVQTGADGFSVFARLHSHGEEHAVGTGLAPDSAAVASASNARRVRINGAFAPAITDLMGLCRIVWLTPSMDGLFTGPGADRRRFLDRMVLAIGPGHAQHATAYEKAMRQRNRLLDRGGNLTSGSTAAWLDGIEMQMAAHGVALAAGRAELVALMRAAASARAHPDRSDWRDPAGFPVAELTLEGPLEQALAEGQTITEAETGFASMLARARTADRAAGRTLTGPHRSDLLVRHVQKGVPAALCSTGEQKALLTGLVLAHADITRAVSGMTPILLLDEIAAHLDPARRAALFDRVHALGGQCFMTGTDRSLFDAMGARAQYFHVDNATVSAQD